MNLPGLRAPPTLALLASIALTSCAAVEAGKVHTAAAGFVCPGTRPDVAGLACRTER